jgi:hypothetical protein
MADDTPVSAPIEGDTERATDSKPETVTASDDKTTGKHRLTHIQSP